MCAHLHSILLAADAWDKLTFVPILLGLLGHPHLSYEMHGPIGPQENIRKLLTRLKLMISHASHATSVQILAMSLTCMLLPIMACTQQQGLGLTQILVQYCQVEF